MLLPKKSRKIWKMPNRLLSMWLTLSDFRFVSVPFVNHQETFFDKKSFTLWLKLYMKVVKAHLEKTSPDEVDVFMKNIQPFVKQVLGEFKEYQFFTGESCDPEAHIALMKYDDGALAPKMWFFKHGMKEVKC